MIMLAPLDIMHERSFYSQFLFKYNDYMHICYFRLYPSRSIHPSSHPHNNPHTDSPSNLLCLLPVLPQQYRLDQLHVQVAILSHFSQDPAVLPCGVADHGGVVSVGDNEGVQDVQEQPLVYVRVLVARQELEEEVVQAQVGDQIPDEDGIVVEEVDQIAQQSHYLLLDSQSFLIVCPDQQRQMYILEDAEGQFLIIDQQIVEQSDSQDGWIGALSIQQVGIDQMGYLCVEKWEIVYCLLENVGDVDQKPQALDQRPFSVVAFSWLLNKESFQSPKDYILQKVVFLVEYALSEARFKELHISQLMRLYVFCLLGVEFSTEQVIADAQQSQSSLGCQLLPAQELYRPDEGSQLQLVQHSQEVSASEAILQTVLGDLLALVRIILIAFLQYLRALQCSQQSMFYHYSCLLARDVDQHSLQDVHVVSPLGQFKPHHFLGYLFDLSNNGGSGGMQVFIYMLGQLENGCWQVVDELMGLFYCLILEFFCVDEASADTGEVGGQFLSADGPVVGLSLQEQLTAFAPAWLSGA